MPIVSVVDNEVVGFLRAYYSSAVNSMVLPLTKTERTFAINSVISYPDVVSSSGVGSHHVDDPAPTSLNSI